LKVFHISLLYFPIGGNGAIYHGKTIIHEIETNEKLSVHIKNQETVEVFDATNILPEYFYISIPLFNDRLEKEIDDWLHVMKYDEVPKNYHSPKLVRAKMEKRRTMRVTGVFNLLGNKTFLYDNLLCSAISSITTITKEYLFHYT